MKRLLSLALGGVSFVALASTVAAQPQPAAPFLQVVTVTVKPEAVPQYEDYVKKIVAATNKIGAPQRVFGYQLMLGGPGSTYLFAVPFSRWGEIDGWPTIPQVLAKAYGDPEAAKILMAGRIATVQSRTEVFRLLSDLSTRSSDLNPTAGFISIIRTEVDPDMASAYELYLSKVKVAQERAGAPATSRRVSAQGVAYTYVTATPFSKHSERDAWPGPGELLRKAYGEEEARTLLQMSLRAVRHREFWVLAYRPDLSRPAVTTSSQ